MRSMVEDEQERVGSEGAPSISMVVGEKEGSGSRGSTVHKHGGG